MKIWVHSCFKWGFISKAIRNYGFRLDRKNPDVIITYGGDGTLLRAEQKYPGIPKLPIRLHPIKTNYSFYLPKDLPKILKALKKGQYKLREIEKVECVFKGKKLLALNEIQIHNQKPYRALRFSLEVDGKKYEKLIGDGILVSTPHGSTGYFSVIGGKPFSKGLMLGFNNVIGKRNPIRVRNYVLVEILRERAWIIGDNNPKMLRMIPGEKARIRKSRKKARFVVI